jgi:hypothetical protein
MGYALSIGANLAFTTIECCACGTVWAWSSELERNRRESKETFYCPNGHPQSFTTSTAEKLQKQLDAAKAETERQKAETERQRQLRIDAERRTIAQRAVVKKLKNRVNCGVCPHCQRTFKQLAAHIKSKHAEDLPKPPTR